MNDTLHATIEEFAAHGYTHIECFCPRCCMTRLRPISYLSRISLGLYRAAISTTALCAVQRALGQPWRLEDVPAGLSGSGITQIPTISSPTPDGIIQTVSL